MLIQFVYFNAHTYFIQLFLEEDGGFLSLLVEFEGAVAILTIGL